VSSLGWKCVHNAVFISPGLPLESVGRSDSAPTRMQAAPLPIAAMLCTAQLVVMDDIAGV